MYSSVSRVLFWQKSPLSGCGGWHRSVIPDLGGGVEAGGLEVQGHPQLHSQFKAEHLRPRVQKTALALALDRLVHISQTFIYTSSQPRDPSKEPLKSLPALPLKYPLASCG